MQRNSFNGKLNLKMTKQDEQLVSKATHLHYNDEGFYDICEECETKAKSILAKQIIHRHKIREYQREEYRAGLN